MDIKLVKVCVHLGLNGRNKNFRKPIGMIYDELHLGLIVGIKPQLDSMTSSIHFYRIIPSQAYIPHHYAHRFWYQLRMYVSVA